MPDYECKRSGLPPLAFTGDLLVFAPREDPPDAVTRWYSGALFQTGAGSFVVAVSYRSRWANRKGIEEPDRHWAQAGDAASLTRWLLDFAPMDGVSMRIPADARKAALRRRKLEEELSRQWLDVRETLLTALNGPEQVP